MKLFHIAFAAFTALSFPAAAEALPPRISIFADNVQRIMRERKTDLPGAVKMLKELGVEGFDAEYRDASVPALLEAGMIPASLYGFLKFTGDDGGKAAADGLVATAVRSGAKRIMAVPDNIAGAEISADEYSRIRDGLRRLASSAAAAGIVPMIEDVGGGNNACSRKAVVRRLLADVPELRLALDSGNLYYAGHGEDILELMREERNRISHVHLKDQTKEDGRKYATLGIGAVPNETVVREMAESGYSGWWTLENFVGADVFADIARQTAVLKSWLPR